MRLPAATLWRLGLRRFPTLFNFIQTNFREWPHVERFWAMYRPLVDVPGARPPGATVQFRGSLGAEARRRNGSVGLLRRIGESNVRGLSSAPAKGNRSSVASAIGRSRVRSCAPI